MHLTLFLVSNYEKYMKKLVERDQLKMSAQKFYFRKEKE